jgi:hypothetical protein
VVAGLAVEILDGLCLPMVAIADEGVHRWVCDLVIVTRGIGTSLTARVDRFLATTVALLLPGWHHGSGHDYGRCEGCGPTVLAIVQRAWTERPWTARPGGGVSRLVTEPA